MAHLMQDEDRPSTSNYHNVLEDDTNDDSMIALVLSEEYASADGATARSISKFSSIPHGPQINTFIHAPCDDSSDYERLIQRLYAYGLYEIKISGDGNCQFSAISDQLYRSPDHHKHVRKEIVKQLKDFSSLYEGYVPMKFKHYRKKMAKPGEWGDHVTLQAAADKFHAKIRLLTSFRDSCFVEIVPRNQPPQRELWLSFSSGVHYNSIYRLKDIPVHKPKRRYWLFS